MNGPKYKALYDKFRDDTIVSRCEQFAKWTLSYIMADLREVSTSGRVVVERDYQEIGALLVNNLSAKLARILFPTQYSFFEASASERFKERATQRGLSEAQLKQALANLETTSNKRLFLNGGYAGLIMALRHLIISGCVLLHRDSKSAKVTAYGLNQFACRRDGTGELLDAVLREYTCVEALPDELVAALRSAQRGKYSRPEQTVEKYTRIHRQTRNGVVGYAVSQQVDCIDVGSASWYPANLCPWLCPTWNLIPGEHYGRGLVEDYAGGFAKLSTLSESATLYGVEMMRVLHLVGAGAGSDIDELASAESGEYVRGDPNTVSAQESGDAKKLQEVEMQIERVLTRLTRAFMYQGATRDAERVTAYELQRDAQEAEYTLGGVYSTLSGSLQIPLAHILMGEADDNALVGIISGDLTPDVTAGIPALGRSSDVQNLLLASQEIASILVLAQADKRINSQKLVDLVLSGRSINSGSIFYTPDEQRKNEEAQAAAQAAQASGVAAQTLSDSSAAIQQTLQGG